MVGVFWSGVARKQKRLLHTAVPSVFHWTNAEAPTVIARRRRATLRDTKRTSTFLFPQQMEGDHMSTVRESTEAAAAASEVAAEEVVAATMETESVPSSVCSVSTETDFVHVMSSSVQTDIQKPCPFLSFDSLCCDDQLLHYYTGLETCGKLMTVFHTLGPAVHSLTYYRTAQVENISVLDQFILMLAKLRQDLDYFPLAKMCGVSVFTAQNIFITWVNFCSRQWSEIEMWPEKDLVLYYCPQDFKAKFPSTRVILDGTEIPVKKPSDPLAQRATFSTYKNRNTVKVITGCTPGGHISYVSPAYGGAASDRQIVERSNMNNMCQPKDSIMADKGFNVQDLFAMNDIAVNIPSFFKKKKSHDWEPGFSGQKNC